MRVAYVGVAGGVSFIKIAKADPQSLKVYAILCFLSGVIYRYLETAFRIFSVC